MAKPDNLTCVTTRTLIVDGDRGSQWIGVECIVAAEPGNTRTCSKINPCCPEARTICFSDDHHFQEQGRHRSTDSNGSTETENGCDDSMWLGMKQVTQIASFNDDLLIYDGHQYYKYTFDQYGHPLP